MNQLSIELFQLKNSTLEMAELVRAQVLGILQATVNFDLSLIDEIELNERQVDNLDVRIERRCEQILALFSPVARDLRFVFAINKIVDDLEGISDNAHAIGKYLLETQTPFSQELMQDLDFGRMHNQLLLMLDAMMIALEDESSEKAHYVLAQEDLLDELNLRANAVIARIAAQKSSEADVLDLINLLTIVRKVEKIGDYLANIAERIIYFIDARVVKHGLAG
ncbi:MAG: phosphate signaling complex protein PhoU [Bacteroidia bacterium]